MHEHCNNKEVKTSSDKQNYLILVGNPNVGKSVIFSYLTKKYVTVSNYPGTTVEISKGFYKKIKDKEIICIDTPGTNSLLPASEDEKVTRDILIKTKLENNLYCVVQIVDAKNLERSLLVTLQLLFLEVPLILVLNMMDEAKNAGINIDLDKLKKLLGISVIPTIATQNKGLDKIEKNLQSLKIFNKKNLLPELILTKVNTLKENFSKDTLSEFFAYSVLAGDSTISEWIVKQHTPQQLQNIENYQEETISSLTKKETENQMENFFDITLVKKANEISRQVTKKTLVKKKNFFVKTFEDILLHPLFGLPFLFLILYFAYWFVGKFAAGTGVDFLENTIFGKYLNPYLIKFVQTFIPIKFVQELLVGEYGIFTMAVTYALSIVLPIVTAFFIFFAVLEDSGYMPRLAALLNKIFKIVGLNGKAVLPMVLGFGCDTMATLTARILETKRERIIVTVLLALGIPCSAQLGVILGMISTLPKTLTIVYIIAITLTMLIVAFFLSKILPGKESKLILEVPPMRLPQLKNIFTKTFLRIKWYLKEAVPLFILGTLILFITDKIQILTKIQYVASPFVVQILGLPAKAANAFLTGFLRRDYGAAGLYALKQQGLLNPHQVTVSLITITLFVPCIANFFIIIKEQGTKSAIIITSCIFAIAFFVGGITNYLLNIFNI